MSFPSGNYPSGSQQYPPIPPVPATKKTLKIVILGDSGVGKTCLLNRYSSEKFTGQYKATIGADFVTKQIVLESPPFALGAAAAAPTTTLSRQVVTLQLWDTAGQERFQSLGVGFYRGADGAILCYDTTDPHSLDHLEYWKNEFLQQVLGGGGGGGLGLAHLSNTMNQFPFVVVGTKIDKTQDRAVPRQRAEEWCMRQQQQQLYPSSSSSSAMDYSTYSSNGTGGTTFVPDHLNLHHYHHPSSPSSLGGMPHWETSAKTGWNVTEVFESMAHLAYRYESYKRQMQPQLFVPPTTVPIDLRRTNSTYSDTGGTGSSGNQGCC